MLTAEARKPRKELVLVGNVTGRSENAD